MSMIAESPMLITCNNCLTSYETEPWSFGLTGRSVRCIWCGHRWFAANLAALGAIAKLHRADLSRLPEPLVDEHSTNPAANPVVFDQKPSVTGEIIAIECGFIASVSPMAQTAVVSEQSGPVRLSNAVALAPMRTLASMPPTPVLRPRKNMESAAATRPMTTKPRRHGGWSPGLLGVILILIAIHGALVWWRSEIVRLLPQTASLYAAIGLPVNLRGLDITDVQTVTNRQDGIGLLVVEGKIVNTTSRTIDVPRVYFSVRDERGLEIYRWTASTMKAPIEPGETVPFRSRLASPPPETNRVFVRFRNRRDLVVGMN